MADVDGEGGSVDSEEEVEQFDDVVSEDGEDGEGEVDEDDGPDGDADGEGDDDDEGDEDEDSSSVDEEDDDDEGSSLEGEEQEDEDDQADDIADNGDADAELFGHSLQKDLPAISSRRADSPTDVRKTKIFPRHKYPKSYAIDAISALPHPCATNAIAASLCMTHLVTGSDDGYIRDYDIFAACNGTNFLSAPQRQHCGFVEGVIKAGVLRSWWHSSNPLPDDVFGDPVRHPVQSLLMHSDALWGLAGLRNGDINLYSVRHNPGKIIHTLSDHTKEIADMAMSPDEKSFISAGWDGNVLIWDLNTGEVSRRFPSQGSQLSAVALRPVYRPSVTPLVSFGRFLAPYSAVPIGETDEVQSNRHKSESMKSEDRNTGFEQKSNASRSSFAEPIEKVASPSADAADTKSDGSYDPLFDDDGEPDLPVPRDANTGLAFPGTAPASRTFTESTDKLVSGQGPLVQSGPPKGPFPFTHSTPLFDQSLSDKFSSDVILTASINGQVLLWDRRAPALEEGVGKLEMTEKCPPWCVSACWSADGSQIYAGRRNGTIDIWDVRQLGTRGGSIPRLLKTLRNPVSSGEVFCVAALPDAKHLVCASNDNIRLWNVSEPDDTRSRAAQFKIITGHHGGQVSQILIDPSARFMISASGNRGWFGESTRTVLIHEIKDIL